MIEYYCCDNMKGLDENEIIDYCPGNLTTLDIGDNAYPIYFCPFCGKEIEGCKKFVKKIREQCKGIEDGTIETISLEELNKHDKNFLVRDASLGADVK